MSEMDDIIAPPDVKTVTMNELLGVEHLTILQGGQPIYLTSAMGSEWKSENLQYFVDMDDRTGFHTLISAATDIVRTSLPRPSKLGSDEQAFGRIKFRTERAIRRAQLHRSLKTLNLTGFELDEPLTNLPASIISPATVDKPIMFIPYEFFDSIRSTRLLGRRFTPFQSNMYEVFKNDPLVR